MATTAIENGLVIGASTGWLYLKGIAHIAEQQKTLKESGARAIEINLRKWSDSDVRFLSLQEDEIFDPSTFEYRSIHLPDIFPDPGNVRRAIKITKNVMETHSIQTAVVHPLYLGGNYPVEQFRAFIDEGIDLAIENMDSRKDSGRKIEDLSRLVEELDCKFVLDVQHVFEQENPKDYLKKLLDAAIDRLAHIHVSGQAKNKTHARVCESENQQSILEFTEHILEQKQVPIIIEGEYAGSDQLKMEIDFLQKSLSPSVTYTEQVA